METLNKAVKTSLRELADDAGRYIDLHHRLQTEGGKNTADLVNDIYVQITVLKIHAAHLQELIDEVDELAALSAKAG